MTALEKHAVAKVEIVSDPSVMSGEPVVKGTRVKAATIMAYLRSGYSAHDIFEDYPSLPVDGIAAVVSWAEITYGAEWKTNVPSAE